MLQYGRTFGPTTGTAYGLLFAPVVVNAYFRSHGTTLTQGAQVRFLHLDTEDAAVDDFTSDGAGSPSAPTSGKSQIGGANFPLANVAEVDTAAAFNDEDFAVNFFGTALDAGVDDKVCRILVSGFVYAQVVAALTTVTPGLAVLDGAPNLVAYDAAAVNSYEKIVGILVETPAQAPPLTALIVYDGINGFATSTKGV